MRPPEERERRLDEACQGNSALRAEVLALLKAEERAGGFLESGVQGFEAPVDVPIVDEPGTVIGSYRLIEVIGQGGMGTVWLAKQSEPVKRTVALKLIKAGMDSSQVIARFNLERQTIAVMDHPNIAKVLDAGTTHPKDEDRRMKDEEIQADSSFIPHPSSLSGRPYFVMELVRGIPITKYCDQHQLSPRERLELFVPVCQAIQHAHQKGIIHRDIKPGNVLVAAYDGHPVPKVIDFGVAKAVEAKLTESTVVTGFGI